MAGFLFLPRLCSRIWHERHKAGEFDGVGDLALVLVAQPCAGGARDLKHARHKLAQDIGLLVIHVIYFFLTGGTRHS